MVDFLNNFSNSCSHRLFMFDRKIGKIEAELRLLEIKLNSIRGFEEENPKPVVTPTNVATEEVPETREKPEAENEAPNEAEEAPVAEVKVDPVIAGYIRMVQFGVPVPAVKLKMKSEGVDPELLKM